MRWEDFERDRELGRGATARVWLARRKSDGTALCLKAFHPGLPADARARIAREWELAQSLLHPNIVRVLGPVEGAETDVLALELFDGGNLESCQPSLPYVLPEVSATIAVEILKALEFAHGRGVVHRDLKPANVLLSAEGRVAVADFGLARIAGSDLTASVGVLGTVDYMAPEQVSGDQVTPASDLFAVAGILYFLVTGTRPFARANTVATLAAIQGESPEPPQRRNPKVSAALARLILRGLEKDPQARFRDAGDFRSALQNYLSSLDLGTLSFGAWKAMPTARTLECLERASAGLIGAAERELARGRWGEFLETLSHLTLKAPESPARARLMEGYRRHRRRRRWVLLWIGGALLGAGTIRWLRPRPPTPVVVAAPAPPAAAAAHKVARVVAPKPPKPVVKTGKVQFRVPEDITVYWDGRRVNAKEELSAEKLGDHFLLMEREGFEPIRAKVSVRADKPAVIKVD